MREQPVLEVEEVPDASLVPYAGNAKLHPDGQVEAIANSIREFGNCDPIGVWTNRDGDLEIVEGHGRVMALQRLGMETAPVIRLDHLSDEARRAYAHIHNQTTLSSGFDVELLEADLEQMDYDWEDFGFEDVPSGDGDLGLSDDYSRSVGKVVYEPRDTAWGASDLYEMDSSRFEGLLAAVEDEGIREMLRPRPAHPRAPRAGCEGSAHPQSWKWSTETASNARCQARLEFGAACAPR